MLPTFTFFPPPALQNIDDKVAGDRRRRKVQVQIVPLRQEDSKRIQNPLGLEIVVGGLAFQSILAATRKVADFHGRFGVPRQSQHRFRFVGRRVDCFYLRKDRIGLLELFLGLHLATLVR